MHLIWVAIVFPVVWGSIWISPTCRRPEIWSVSFAIMLFLLVGWVAVNLFEFSQSSSEVSIYQFRSLLFFLIRSFDLPLLALTVATGLAWVGVRRRAARRPTGVNEATGERESALESAD